MPDSEPHTKDSPKKVTKVLGLTSSGVERYYFSYIENGGNISTKSGAAVEYRVPQGQAMAQLALNEHLKSFACKEEDERPRTGEPAWMQEIDLRVVCLTSLTSFITHLCLSCRSSQLFNGPLLAPLLQTHSLVVSCHPNKQLQRHHRENAF